MLKDLTMVSQTLAGSTFEPRKRTGIQRCEIIRVYPDDYEDHRCEKLAISESVDGVHVCYDCAKMMDEEELMPPGWEITR